MIEPALNPKSPVRFQSPEDPPCLPATLHVAIYSERKTWLAPLNLARPSGAGWSARICTDERELRQLLAEHPHVFVILEMDFARLEEQTKFVRHLFVGNPMRSPQPLGVAIVGPGNLGQDDGDEVGNAVHAKLSHQRRTIECAFRSAGALLVCWQSDELQPLIGLLNRATRQLPGVRASFREYVLSCLPWHSSV